MKLLTTITVFAALALSACGGGGTEENLIDQARSDQSSKAGRQVSKKQVKEIIAKAEQYTARQNKSKQR